MNSSSRYYPLVVVFILSLNFGIVFFDRNALNFLMPFVQKDIHLSNTQVGMLAGALSLTWALSGLFVSAVSDRVGMRKPILIAAVIAFSLCSFLSGVAVSFVLLLGTRLLMGIAEGPVLPISQVITANEVPHHHRGVAMGVMQNFGSNLLGSFVAPVLLIAIAEHSGWRNAFYLAGVPGLVTAFLIFILIREPPVAEKASKATGDLSFIEIFACRNMVICAAISVLLVAYLVITWSFLPLFLTQQRGFSPSAMGGIISALGISAAFSSFLVPGLSDRVGRKPVMIGVPLLGLILPIAAAWYSGPLVVLGLLLFIGWAVNGTFPLFMATIPSETVPGRYVATALAMVMGAGEVLGGVFGPVLAGFAADRFGLNAPLVILAGLTLVASCLALGLRETLLPDREGSGRPLAQAA